MGDIYMTYITTNISKKLNVLKNPTEREPEIVATLSHPATLTVDEREQTPIYGFNDKLYIKVKTENFIEGYVLLEAIERINNGRNIRHNKTNARISTRL